MVSRTSRKPLSPEEAARHSLSPQFRPEDVGQQQLFSTDPYEVSPKNYKGWSDLPKDVRAEVSGIMKEKHGLTHQKMVANIHERARQHLEERTKEGTENWYPQAKKQTAEMARSVGAPFSRASRAVAAASVRNPWDYGKSGKQPNLEAAQFAGEHVAKTGRPPTKEDIQSSGRGIMGIHKHVGRAGREFMGEKVLSGAKVERFEQNIARPHHPANKATIDTIAMRAATRLEDEPGFAALGMTRKIKGEDTPVGYQYLEHAYQQASRQARVPHPAQPGKTKAMPVESYQALAWLGETGRKVSVAESKPALSEQAKLPLKFSRMKRSTS